MMPPIDLSLPVTALPDLRLIRISGVKGSWTARSGDGSIEHPHKILASGKNLGAVLYELTKEDRKETP